MCGSFAGVATLRRMGLAHMPSRENTGPMTPAPSPRPAIHGVDVDPHGRCCHYRSSVDVIANRCATCNAWWACYQCHEQCADHPFGTVSVDADNTILCGVCGITMGYELYSRTHSCPHCGHGFNPGCALHKELYFHTLFLFKSQVDITFATVEML